MAWLHPDYVWTLAAVPLAVLLFLWAAWQRRRAFERLGDRPLVARLAAAVSPRRRRWKAALVATGIALLAVALIGPRFGTKLREVKREGVDLVVALDVSLSMQAEDVAPNRLTRAKNEIKKLLDALQGDRVGLVVFAGDAFIQCPLTTDYGAVRLFLDVVSPDLMPTPGTDFGAALRMALQAFEAAADPDAADEARTRALLVVSDGENHVSGVESILAEAREAGIVIFTAGVGETAGTPIPLYRNGQRIGYKKDRDGRVVSTRLEEDALQALAEDGAYFRIARTSSSLPQLIASLDRLERTEFDTDMFEEYEERYQWPLAVAVLLLAVERLISDRRRRRSGAALAVR
ncbi:MAG: VWA domain-containing protein [Bacteroidetes bacterium]|nr:VWA domain-containing protein [Rhodothermaceae bacterium RA]RMH55427.1 MAG: VWA domain-containing protein [Bacteroidota bacterium]